MQDALFGFYPPTVSQYEKLWGEALVVIDTNVLLDLYRVPADTKDELISAFDLLGDRLWLPYQIALEFQRNRISVIGEARDLTSNALRESQVLIGKVKVILSQLDIDKRGLGINPITLVSDIDSTSEKLREAIEAVHQSQLDIAGSDPIREKVDELFRGRVGPAPISQAALDKQISDGEERYSSKIPPGFEDADKGKNPAEATFFHDGMEYKRKFGDLIIWRQILDHAKSTGSKTLMIVTRDNKGDWWWKEKGRTLGPHPELIREAKRVGGIDLLWMYSSSQFLENAKLYAKATVSDKAVSDLESVARNAITSTSADLITQASAHIGSQEFRSEQDLRYSAYQHIEVAVANWLLRSGYSTVLNRYGTPDLYIEGKTSKIGFEVKYISGSLSDVPTTSIVRTFLRIKEKISGDGFSRLVLVLVYDIKITDQFTAPFHLTLFLASMMRLRDRFKELEIVAGVFDGARFEPYIQLPENQVYKEEV